MESTDAHNKLYTNRRRVTQNDGLYNINYIGPQLQDTLGVFPRKNLTPVNHPSLVFQEQQQK